MSEQHQQAGCDITNSPQVVGDGNIVSSDNQGAQGNFYGAVTIIYEAARDRPTDPQVLEAARHLLSQMPTADLPPA
ncbi:MAG: hypothetical protein HC914_14725, partial [Chloroflexaceae bacterium]|nr:hypothetical protein [Chloroflexaceae bacterium]